PAGMETVRRSRTQSLCPNQRLRPVNLQPECHGTLFAGSSVMIEQLKRRAAELEREWNDARARHPRIAYGVLAVSLVVALLPAIWGTAFLINLPRGLPDDTALSKIGEMDQA